MYPFKTTTNVGRTLKKKPQPSQPSESQSTEGLTPAKTGVRKSSHQKHMEEMSRKSKSSSSVEASESSTSSTSSSRLTSEDQTATGADAYQPTSSQRISKKIKKFERHQATVSKESDYKKYFSSGSSSLASSKPAKLPFCLKGSMPCSCVPECKKTSAESFRRTREYTPPLRSASNSPPLQRKVSVVRKIFENTSAPTTPIMRSPTLGESTKKVKDIIKQLVKQTERVSAGATAIEQTGTKGSPKAREKRPSPRIIGAPTPLCIEEELGAALESLTLPKESSTSQDLQSSKGDDWKPLSLSDVYKKGNFGPESVPLVITPTCSLPSQEFDKPLSLTELYSQANLPLSTTNFDILEKNTSDDTSVLSLPELYKQASRDSEGSTLHSKSTSYVNTSKYSRLAADAFQPLSLSDIYKQAESLPSTSTATKVKRSPRSEKCFSPRTEALLQETAAIKRKLREHLFGSKSTTNTFLLEYRQEPQLPESDIKLTSSSMPNFESFATSPRSGSDLDEPFNSGLESTPTNFIDLSSYVTSEPTSIKSTCSLETSHEFNSESSFDLTSYMGEESSTSESHYSKQDLMAAAREECLRSVQEPKVAASEQLAKYLKLFEEKRTISKQFGKHSKFQITFRRMQYASLEIIYEDEEMPAHRCRSMTEPDLVPEIETTVPLDDDNDEEFFEALDDHSDFIENLIDIKEDDALEDEFSSPFPIDPTAVESELEGACIRNTISTPGPSATYLETSPVPSTSKNGDEDASNVIPKYTFRSPQSGAVYAVEEWGDEAGYLPDLSFLGKEPEELPLPPSDDDGLDAIFGPLQDEEDYQGESYVYEQRAAEGEEEDLFEDTQTGLGQGGGGESPDLEFIFDDADSHGNEIAELYSYTEQPELQLNVKAFEDQMDIYSLPPSWQRLSVEMRRSVVMRLLDQLECSKKPVRMRSARCLLYIAQGCWAEVQSDTEQQHWTRLNALMLFQLGAFNAFTELLNIEIDNSTAAHVAMRKIAVSLADSQDLRVILSVLYIITEVIRNEKLCEDSEYKSEIEAFVFDIGHANGEDHLVIKLLSMVTRFCSGAAPHFPMKKVLLLLWKVILVSLGGMSALKDQKADKRRRANLPPQDEDTMEIAKTMRSSSPPASASDLLEAQNQKRSTRPFRRSLMKQSSLDDQESLGLEMETSMANENGDDLPDMTEYDERRPTDNSETSHMFNNHILNMYSMQVSPPPQHDIVPRGLPWKPKVRQKDIDAFLDSCRLKFLGYSLPGDQTTLFGLPEPIHEGVRILREHVYTSLAELQIQKEEEIARNPLSTKEEEIDLTPAETLYQAMLPNLPQYMIALLKILLAAAPTSKAKTDSINIMADVLPEEMPMTVVQSMKLGIDVNRHKEIIVKAVSAILLLLLKHFKLNHIYQFEFMSQHLVFANCIPLVLKFFNQNIMGYIGAKNVIPILDFPSCVIGDQPELTAEGLEIGDAAPFSWRNMFSCINLLRILNKLTKWKHSRIMMLVVFKSAPILKRTLKIRHAMTQLYVLKLLKMQTKYLGRQWRKSNMKTISAIYQKVRHRLNDDWAYGNDLDARPWDFQAEECALRASVDRFNNRRYTQVSESEFEPVDNNPSSVLGQPHDLSESFKQHYELWLQQEVHGTPIDWGKLLLGEEDSDDAKEDEP